MFLVLFPLKIRLKSFNKITNGSHVPKQSSHVVDEKTNTRWHNCFLEEPEL